jgi:ferric-dicitrate binding protein FerR (iron transport regulator)
MKGTQQTDEGSKSQGPDSVESGQNVEDVAGAVRWFHRFVDTDMATLRDEELAEWAEWVEEEPRLEQFRTLGRIWGSHASAAANESGPRPTGSDLSADEYDGSMAYSRWLAEHAFGKKGEGREGGSSAGTWRRPGRLITFLAMAACTIGMTFAVVKYGHLQFLDRLPFMERLLGEQVQSYVTGPSEHKDVWLSDGSHLTLGAGTELTVHYTAKRRFIFLDRGEGSFSVAHNPLRPFTVLAGGGAITALSTQFDVRRDMDPTGGEHVVVTVSSGSVEVGPPMATISSPVMPDPVAVSGLNRRKQAEWTPARLVKGQELTFGTDGPEGTVEHVNLEEVAAWKEGRLEYRHEPFKTVIPRVNRYSRKPIVLADGDVGELPYSGTVFEGQVDDWLRALPKVYPIEVIETPDRVLLRYDRAKAGE